MKDVKINNKNYKCPQKWEDITVKMFEELKDLNSREELYNDEYEYVFKLTALILSCTVEEIKTLSPKQFGKISDSFDWVTIPLIPSTKSIFKIEGVSYIAMDDYDKITMGDYISLDIKIKESVNKGNLISNIIPILIRRAIQNEDGKFVPGPFDAENYNENYNLFRNNLSICDVIGFTDFFFSWRESMIKKSSYFASPKDEDESHEDIISPDITVKFDYESYQWLLIVEQICNRFPAYSPEDVYKLNFLSCLNWLSMWLAKDKHQAYLNKSN